jgi:hypothetical protein
LTIVEKKKIGQMTQHIFLGCFLEELELDEDSGSVGEGEGQVSRRVSL